MEGKKARYYWTKLCGTFETQGKCDDDNCKKAHGPGELRKIQLIQEPCRLYAEGKCKKGDKCMYLHEGPVVEQSQTEVAQPSCSPSHEPSLTPSLDNWPLLARRGYATVRTPSWPLRAPASVPAPAAPSPDPLLTPSLDNWPLLARRGHATVRTPSWPLRAPASVPAPAAPSPDPLPLVPKGHAHLQSPSWPGSALASVTTPTPTPTPVSPPLPVSVSVPVPVPIPMAAPVSVPVSSASATTQVVLSTAAATTTTTVTAPENATSGSSIHSVAPDYTAPQFSEDTNGNATEEDFQGYTKNLRDPTHSKFLPFE